MYLISWGDEQPLLLVVDGLGDAVDPGGDDWPLKGHGLADAQGQNLVQGRLEHDVRRQVELLVRGNKKTRVRILQALPVARDRRTGPDTCKALLQQTESKAS